MTLEVIQSQKQNFRSNNTRNLIKRDILPFAKKQMDHNMIKVITGARRVGKSTLAEQMLTGRSFSYFNFDDPAIDFGSFDYVEFTKQLDEVYGYNEIIFFDEIQNLDKWEIYLNKLHREGRNLVVTGSNSNLLSGELATALTGRAVEIKLLPFSWSETKLNNSDSKFDDYILNGNFPEVLTSKIESKYYYQSLYSSTIYKDVVSRYAVRSANTLEAISKYLLSTVTSLLSYKSISDKLGINVQTVSDYLGYLKQSFLFYELQKFSTKYSEISRSDRKLYVIDYAFSTFNLGLMSENFGYAFENAVFIEFLRKGFVPNVNLFYHTLKSSNEIDFLIINPDKSLSIYQVSYSIEDQKTFEREIRALEESSNEFPQKLDRNLIFFKGKKPKNQDGINFLNFFEFEEK